MVIRSLPFDSELFGYPVGQWDWDQKWEESEFVKNAVPFRLTYLFSREKLVIQHPDIHLMDTKIVLAKKVVFPEMSTAIRPFPSELLISELESLAYESGVYSRFMRDSRCSNGEFKKLYKTWISKEVKNKQVYTSPGLEGMLTLSFEQEEGTIGLLAVSKEHQGQGWGRKLLNAALFFSYKKGINTLKVATQAQNQKALNLYFSMGFHEAERVYIYHYWNPDFS